MTLDLAQMRSAGPVRVEWHGSVALVEIDNPPVNALAQPVRRALLEAIVALDSDTAVRAIVIHGVGRQFVAGADVREFDEAPKSPLLNDVLLRIEACSKPVVAALHGAALGGGAELALASHYRLAARDLTIGFPEIKLGLMPGSGGTVRLPRLVGAKASLDLMLEGEPIGVERAQSIGLVDRVTDGDIRTAAKDWGSALVEAGAKPRRLRDLPVDPEAARNACVAARKKMPSAARQAPAGERIVEAVEAAAAQSFDAALAHARTLFEACRTSTESGALRHLFFAERARAEYSAPPREIRTVGVVGAGTMGVGIAISLASAGYATILVDTKPGAATAGVEKVRASIAASVAKGRLTTALAERAQTQLHAAADLAAVSSCDLVIEAVFESLAVKREVFAALGRLVGPEVVLATNTSTLDVDAIADASGRPEQVVGMHFFSPAHVMRLVEIVRGTRSGEAAVATVASVTRKLGKTGIEVGNAFGFVGNRMLYAYGRERELLMLEGATPQQVDCAMEKFGMAMGPNAVSDLAGIDVGVAARREWRERPSDPRYFRVSEALVARGWLGQKTGRGFYRYVDGKREPDPEVEDLIRAEASELAIPQRTIPDEEIVERCVLALVNEGARLLEEGVARRVSDIDVVWCLGYGFPRYRGGPMHHANRVGLSAVVAALQELHDRTQDQWWWPAPLLLRWAES